MHEIIGLTVESDGTPQDNDQLMLAITKSIVKGKQKTKKESQPMSKYGLSSVLFHFKANLPSKKYRDV